MLLFNQIQIHIKLAKNIMQPLPLLTSISSPHPRAPPLFSTAPLLPPLHSSSHKLFHFKNKYTWDNQDSQEIICFSFSTKQGKLKLCLH